MQGQDQTWPLASITLTSATSLVHEADDEDSTIRIGDISNGNGAGSLACYIGGIWNNPQPVGGNVVVVTLDLDNDQLGYDAGAARVVTHLLCLIVTHLNLACAPSPGTDRPCSMTVESCKQRCEATVAQQQKQIETLTAQLREQAAQIQKVSAQVEMIRPDAASGGESIRLLSRSAVREVSVSSIQIQPPREPARRLFCCTVAASLCEAPIPTRAWRPSAAPLTERRLQLNSFGSLESA